MFAGIDQIQRIQTQVVYDGVILRRMRCGTMKIENDTFDFHMFLQIEAL